MKYTFPHINHIDEVKPHLNDNFVVVQKDGYTVINYLFQDETTFFTDDPKTNHIRRECRGLIFDSEGYISARRFHKFFNLGENFETWSMNIDLSQPHVILEKLDGSMITPFEDSKGIIRWGTKMGETDVSRQIEDFLKANPHYETFARKCIDSSTTPIFEWVSNKQRIVLPYENDNLVLLSIRGIQSGWYMPYRVMTDIAQKYNIAYVKTYELENLDEIVDSFQHKTDIEGIVLRFEDGHMIKVKTDWYVRLHKTKEAISSEKNVVELILNNSLDDLKPVLMDEDAKKIADYETNFSECMLAYCKLLDDILISIKTKKTTRKEYAIKSAEAHPPKMRSVVFKFFDVDYTYFDLVKYVSDMILKHCSTNKKFAEFKEEIYFTTLEY